MNKAFFEAATKARASKAIRCEKIQRTAEKLSIREFEGDIKVKIHGDYEDKAAQGIKKELSRNWAYPLYKIVTGALLQWTDQNKTEEIKPKDSILERGLSKIYSGLSLQYFIDNIFGNALFNRFNDFMVVDKTEDGKQPIIFTVPISNVFDYKIIGSDVIYLLYLYKTVEDENNKKTQIFRYYGVMDGMEGYYFVEIDREGESVTVLEPVRLRRDENNVALNNSVRQIGSLLFDETDLEVKESRIAAIIDKLELYRKQYDILVISNIIHAFPEKITISIPCPKCDGTGQIEVDDSFVTCPLCHGSKRWIATKPTDITFVPTTISDSDKLAFPDMVKYVTKDIGTMVYQSGSLKDLRAEIISDGTGLTVQAASGLKTATEIVENRIPLNSKLNTIITADVQPTFKWIVERVNELWWGAITFEAAVNYQKFYTGLASNSIMNELKEAKENELHPEIKLQLQKDYINAKYADSPEVRDVLLAKLNINLTTKKDEESNLS